MTSIRSLREAARPLAARLALVLLFAASAHAAAAQQVLQGRVVKSGGPAAPGVRVQLHRVTQTSRGQVDSTVSGADGRFSFRMPPVDTAAGFTVFFSTAIADGVRYFGPAIHPGETPASYAVTVYDTASSPALADSVRVSRRDVFLIPDMDGSMQVAEIIRLRNPARRTLVSESRPLVSVTLPPGVDQFEAGEGDRADSARAGNPGLARVGDRAWLTDPLIPGDRDFFFRYRLPARVKRMPVALGRATDTLYVYVRQPAPDVNAAGLGEGVPFTAENEQFIRYTRTGLASDDRVAVDWRGPTPPPVDPRWAALGIAAAILAAGVVVAARRSRAAG
ncbi:MAG TPA: carboxypeptidase-like regulatory domain-containing protein [Longimicrobium sp.]|nr:carboxypeptidase-like regulatory domain-containing protein [Longimicrobium sp.]